MFPKMTSLTSAGAEPMFRSGNPKSTTHFSRWILTHRSLILPLLGDSKVAQKLKDDEVENIGTTKYNVLREQPTSIKAKLKPHQLEGVAFLQHLRKNDGHGILADEMGLGKTLQVLSFSQLVMDTETDDQRPFLVICPLSVIGSWGSEIAKWTDMKAVQYNGDDKQRQIISKQVRNKEADIVLTTYETLVNDTYRLVRMACWRSAVLDEGHRIKNSTTKIAASVQKLKTEQRIILTGTPIQNDLGETWAILNWLYPNVFVRETLPSFKEAFLLGEGKVDGVFVEDLKNFLKVIMLRRLKESTAAGLEIPPKKEVIVHLPLTECQKRLYLEVLTGVTDGMEGTAGRHILETPPASPGSENFPYFESQAAPSSKASRSILNILMELRKICVHPLLVQDQIPEEDSISMATLISGSSKFIFLRRLLEQEVNKNKKKMLIFSGFDYALNCCETVLEQMGIKSVRLDGRTCFALRKWNIHRFMELAEYQVFIMATRAGGEGITLTAAEVIVFLDLDFNPQVTAQAEARAHRIGQEKAVTVYKLCTRESVEYQMIHRMDKKIYLASKVMDNMSNAAGSEIVASDATLIMNLIHRSRMAVSVETAYPEQLLKMKWESLLELCTGIHSEDVGDLPSPPPSPSTPGRAHLEEDEKQWLSRSGRIETRLFDGKIFRRPLPTNDIPVDLSRAERRINKRRVVYDDEIGYFVSKDSTLCKPWEAVPTLTSPTVAERPPKIEMKHLKACMVCGKTRNLAKCLHCPNVFHEKCVDRPRDSQKQGTSLLSSTVCPKHHCAICNKTASNAGGLLFTCAKCPRSYCIDCIDLKEIKPMEQIPDFQKLGYERPNHIRYILCQGCNQAGSMKANDHNSRVSKKRKRYFY